MKARNMDGEGEQEGMTQRGDSKGERKRDGGKWDTGTGHWDKESVRRTGGMKQRRRKKRGSGEKCENGM